MKTIITILTVIIMASCNKDDSIRCTTCKEQNTGYSQQFCGTRREVKAFEDQLKRTGSNFGQKWSCK